MQQLDPFANDHPDSPILFNVWQNSRWKKMYLAHMITLMEENISNHWYIDRAGQLHEGIDEAIQNDPNKFFTYAESIENLSSSVGKSVGISELMETRDEYLNGTLYFQFSQPAISNITHAPETVFPNSEVLIMAEISSADEAFLGYRHLLGGQFQKAVMYDDGAHNDGAAGDGTWASTIPVNGTSVEYYIYAENSNAGVFSPARAEYEFYALSTFSTVAINEFMASNDQTEADQDGEFDDWIELYNNTETAISLSNCYLSDDLEEPGKWQFPDTAIAAGAYLIIWADKDTLQQGLHCNFKLSASGEDIILSDESGIMIDQVSFSLQTTDISSGRYPNGTGSISFMAPTFASENLVTGTITQEKVRIPELSIYPNPASDFLIIAMDDPQEHQVYMYNIFGQLMDQWRFGASKTIDVRSLSPGIYLISVDGLATGKFIKR